MDKTVKIRAYVEPGAAQAGGEPALTKEQALEFAALQERLQEERNKSLEQLKTIGQLREGMKQEQAKVADAAKRMNDLDAALKQAQSVALDERSRLQVQIDAEMRKTVAAELRNQQLQAQLLQMQAKLDGLADHAAAMQAKEQEVAELRGRLQELVGVLSKVGSIIEAARVAGRA